MVPNKANGQTRPWSFHVCLVKLLVVVFLLPGGTVGVNNRPVITVNPVSPGTGDGIAAQISEDAEPGAVLAVVTVADTDAGADGKISCDIVSDSFALEKIDEGMYKVNLTLMLDREDSDTSDMDVVCQDNGTPRLDARVSITAEVLDVNDNAPYFQEPVYTFAVAENTLFATFYVHAEDSDIGQNAQIVYSIPHRYATRVSIDNQIGTLTMEVPLDYELNHEYSFRVVATDKGVPSLSSEVEVDINIEDMNDNQPLFIQDLFTYSISENAPVNKTVGTVSATDLDSGEFANMVYSLTGCGDFNMSSNGTITVAKRLNRARKEQYDCMVTVFDNPYDESNSFRSTSRVVILVSISPISGHPATAVPSKALLLVLWCLWISMVRRVY